MSVSPFVINAAGKLTALGGSAQSEQVAQVQFEAASQHVDLALLRSQVSKQIAGITGAEGACITSGAAAGIAISVAALITGDHLHRIQQLPQTDATHQVILQAGHAINFGAPVEQMIRLGGGKPRILGSASQVHEQLLLDCLANEQFTALLYVKSHHCVQTNQISLERCVENCHRYEVPVIVDAAAEEDLSSYLNAGADLVIYSGGKAFCGPTSGFIVGNADLIAFCELQSQGISRTMKVGKDTIAGLGAALNEYVAADNDTRLGSFQARNTLLMSALSKTSKLHARLQADEAGRPFNRVAVSLKHGDKQLSDEKLGDKKHGDITALVHFLKSGSPSIRTRNHHLNEGYLLIDPRELSESHVGLIAKRLLQFDQQQT